MRAVPLFVAMTLFAAAKAASAHAGYGLDTPIEILAAHPDSASVLNRDIPGLLTNDNYSVFKALTLKQVGALSGGRLDKQTLSRTEADLRALPPGNAIHPIAGMQKASY